MTLMEPWLLAASRVCACGFQATAEMNWGPSEPPPPPGLEKSRLAMGLASAR